MNQSDIFYRAFLEYKKQTEDGRELKTERRAVGASNPESDIIETQRSVCTIDEDWILAIEEGLVHIEKAINEGRQFIRSRGEVVPIEKVKRVSKDSVEHLAKHSDLITRVPEEGGDLIPDKLYIVERLSDFAVYENRFLYMLLCYLKSFISLRYNKILELTNTYNGSLSMNKAIAVGKRKTFFELKLTDERKDDNFLRENNPLKPLIDRIDLLLKSVMHYLATPLMQEVAKVPMLKPPVTKTNVLKMNRNFKGAVALYDFVTAYDKKGYSAETQKVRINPLPDETAEEFAEVVLLTSFLTYKSGLNLKKPLKAAYDEEENRRRKAEEERKKEQLLLLKRRITENGDDPLEYMLMLEKRNKALEQDSLRLTAAKKEIEGLNGEISLLKENIQALNGEIEQKQIEILELTKRFTDEINRINAEHVREVEDLNLHHNKIINELNERHITETEELTNRHKAEIEALTNRYDEQIQSLTYEYETSISTQKELYKTEIQSRDTEIANLQDILSGERKEFESELEREKTERKNEVSELQTEYGERINELVSDNFKKNAECERLLTEKIVADSRLNALRSEYNLISKDEDFTKKATFDELEHQLKIFKAFFKEEWKKSKKRIKSEILKPGANLKSDTNSEEPNITTDTNSEEHDTITDAKVDESGSITDAKVDEPDTITGP